MYNCLHELFGGDVGVVVVLTLLRFLAHINRLGRAVLQAAEALDAVRAECGVTVDELDVALGAQLCTLSAGNAGVLIDGELLCLLAGKLRPSLALDGIKRIAGRLLLGDLACEDLLCDLCGELFAALLRKLRGRGREHQRVREQPDAGALVGNALPVAEGMNLIELVKPRAEVACRLADAEHISVGAYLHALHKLLNSAGQTAAVAGENEADPFRLRGIGDNGLGAHHDNVGVPESLSEIFRKIKAISRAGEAINNVGAHKNNSFHMMPIL